MQVTLPEMGESVTEGTVAKWLKQPGDPVREGEALVEVTTDKVDAEIPAPASGKLVKILAEAGQTITVGAAGPHRALPRKRRRENDGASPGPVAHRSDSATGRGGRAGQVHGGKP